MSPYVLITFEPSLTTSALMMNKQEDVSQKVTYIKKRDVSTSVSDRALFMTFEFTLMRHICGI